MKNMNSEKLNASDVRLQLFSLVNKGIKYDLDRMFKAAALCGDPQKSYKSIHVAGTNGKGSTCAYIESVLRQSGYKTGLYTSPHITNFEERFKINGVDIEESVWLDVYKEQQKVIDDLGLTFFEAATLISFEIFKRSKIDYAVFEVGMGGRLDATNIITPQVSVITKLSLDHQEYLGDTIEKIAGEKLGIVKTKVPVVMLDPVNPPVKSLAEQKCKETGSDLTFVNTNNAGDIVNTNYGVSFRWNNHKYDISLSGEHQVQNALLALTALQKVAGFNYDQLYNGMKNASLPGRFQTMIIEGRTVIIDVGHNPDAMNVLTKAINARFPGKSILFVVGMMKDKDVSSAIDILTKNASTLYFAKPKIERAAEAADLCAIAENEFGFAGRCLAERSVGEALRRAVKEAYPNHDVICVTGSFHTVDEALFAVSGRVSL
ncbi:MAG: bifunctional folylpolyglutamate synthase/dihydrofolate synthase [Chitinispirillia bacterium]|nr:bifunctional folylpolyglutamate synthase/dihydrofolate synthase [Chitinispirillia bacterium]